MNGTWRDFFGGADRTNTALGLAANDSPFAYSLRKRVQEDMDPKEYDEYLSKLSGVKVNRVEEAVREFTGK